MDMFIFVLCVIMAIGATSINIVDRIAVKRKELELLDRRLVILEEYIKPFRLELSGSPTMNNEEFLCCLRQSMKGAELVVEGDTQTDEVDCGKS